MVKSSDFYNIADDYEKYPNAWAMMIVGGRSTGKTYSALKDCVLTQKRFLFMKRTDEDVKLLCAGNGKIGKKATEFEVDFSPFKSLNRDMGWDIQAFSIMKGIGGFWKVEEGSPIGAPIGYIVSLNSVSKFKGFDLSDCRWMIFDEFIPASYDRVSRGEGAQLLDFYKTVTRAMEELGYDPLKLICLANATEISNPTFNILEITDDVADMQASGEEERYIEGRDIYIHILPDNTNLVKEQKKSAIYRAMAGTAWGDVSFGNKFAYNDFSNVVGRISMKGYVPVCSFKYKKQMIYVWRKNEKRYITSIPHQKTDRFYDLNLENDQKLFYREYVIDLRCYCIEGKLKVEKYTMYDLIMNYKKFFKDV